MRRWHPFQVLPAKDRLEKTRPILSIEGVGDRLRAAAFAEIQAREAFLWAAERFESQAPPGLCSAWCKLAREEQKHLDWLLNRIDALGLGPADRPVSERLWRRLTSFDDARRFAFAMADAEERGRKAGDRFRRALAGFDPESGRIFGGIADEEVAHIKLAGRFYPD